MWMICSAEIFAYSLGYPQAKDKKVRQIRNWIESMTKRKSHFCLVSDCFSLLLIGGLGTRDDMKCMGSLLSLNNIQVFMYFRGDLYTC